MDQTKPLKIHRANKQYLYSDEGHEYLDCLNSTAHVGHAHPHVVTAGQTQMGKLTTAQGYVSSKTTEFVKLLTSIMPHDLNVVYLCNSEAEANDLAIRVVRKVSGSYDLVTMKDAYHGNLTSTLDVSPALHGTSAGCVKKPYVHILDVPDVSERDGSLSDEKCASDAEKVITHAANKGRGIAGLLCDPMFV